MSEQRNEMRDLARSVGAMARIWADMKAEWQKGVIEGYQQAGRPADRVDRAIREWQALPWWRRWWEWLRG